MPAFIEQGAWLPRVAERAASVVEFPIQGFARAATAAQMLSFARWCRRERIAVVQTCDLYANIFGLPGAALARVPVRIGSRRELNPDKTPAQIRLQRLAYRCATKVVANSAGGAGDAGDARASRHGRFAVIPNGVDLRVIRPGASTRGAVRTIVTVANLRPEKATKRCSAAAATLVALASRAALQSRRRRASPRGAWNGWRRRSASSRHVEFLGHREDVAALLARCRCLRPAVALGGVPQRRHRSDGGGASRRRVARSAASSI